MDDDTEHKKAKGTKKCATKTVLNFDKNNLYFEYVGPTKCVSFYEYHDSKERFDKINNNWFTFGDALKKQKELLKKNKWSKNG